MGYERRKEVLHQTIRGWINYFKIGSMKTLCRELDGNIRYRIRMCIWKHWKTPQNKEKNLVGLSTLFQTNFFRLFFRYCTGV